MLSATGPTRLFLLLLFLLVGLADSASAFNFNANWDYRQAGGEELETQTAFQQRYGLGVGPALTYQPTHAISASAYAGYTRSEFDRGDGLQTFETLTPGARLGVSNDIFTALLSGTSDQAGSDSNLEPLQRSWDATLASRWQIPFWPSIRLNYGERTGVQEDAKAESQGLAVDWNLVWAQLYYQFNDTQSEDQNSKDLVDSSSHFARLESSGQLLDRRLGFTLSQQFQHVEQNFTPGPPGQASAKVDQETDPQPTDPDYADPQGGLPLEVGTNERLHLRFATTSNFAEQIDILRLFLKDPLTVDTAAALEWNLYVRNALNAWELAQSNIQGAPSAVEEDSIDIPVFRSQREILLVATNSSAEKLTFMQVEAVSELTEQGTAGSAVTRTSYLTNLGLRARLTRTLNASTFLNQEHFEVDNGFTSENDRQSVGGQLSWSPYTFLTESVGYSQTLETRSGQPDQLNRSYSMTVATIPLPTMNVTLGGTRLERFTGEQKIASGYRYSLASNARIYPDLTSALFLSYGDDEVLDSEGLSQEVKSLTGRMNLNARLTRKLTADVTTNYRESETSASGNATSSTDGVFSLSYRPSDLLQVRGSYATMISGDVPRDDELSVNMALSLLRTYKAQLALYGSHRQAGDRMSDTISLDGSWNISNHLSLRTSGSYNMSERDAYSFRTFLTFAL